VRLGIKNVVVLALILMMAFYVGGLFNAMLPSLGNALVDSFISMLIPSAVVIVVLAYIRKKRANLIS
jgi:hypothetical protein